MNHTILLVDESFGKGETAHKLSGRLNGCWDVHTTSTEKICYKASQLHPDCILFDSCHQNAQASPTNTALRKDDHTRDIPVIMLFEAHEEQSIRQTMDLDICDFMIKPLDVNELLLRLEALDRKGEHLQMLQQKNHWLSHLSLVARNTANAVVILLPDGTIEWENKGFEKMYGYSLADYKRHFRHEIYSENSNRLKKAVEQLEKGKKAFTLEHKMNHRNGETRWVQATLTPVYDSKGRLQKIVSVESDITELKAEKQRSDELLLNIMPFEIAEQLKKKGSARSKKYKTATVMFGDFANFTGLTKHMSVSELIRELNEYVRTFDEIIERHFVEKIKTIGDAYMCAGGLPLKNNSNPFDVTLAGLEIRKFIEDRAREKRQKGEQVWQLRLGIHSGEVMAGVIGSKRFAYDIWGNTVNIASKMEEMSEVGKINVSGATHDYLQDYFDMSYRGKVQIKNTPEVIDMYFVNRIKPEYSQDYEGIFPNQRFRKILARY